MMRIAALLLLIPCLSFAQKKETPKSDTLTVEMKASEVDIIDTQVQQYNKVMQEIQERQQRLREIEANYNNLLRMKVEAIGGDSKKYFTLKDKKLYYMKP